MRIRDWSSDVCSSDLAQTRILEVFTQWKAPANFKIELFVIRVGDWGGYMMLDCDDPLAVHKFCSMLPAFVFEDRKRVVSGKSVYVRVDLGGSRLIQKKNNI